MAKKPADEEAPKSKPVKKTPVRKSPKAATKKVAAGKKTATNAAITSISATPPTPASPVTEKKSAPKPSRTKNSSPHSGEERKEAKTEATQRTQTEKVTAPENASQQSRPKQPFIQVRRESFRPKPQENRSHDDSSPSDGFSQPETVGGESTFGNGRNKRRNRNRNRRQNDDRQEEPRGAQDNAPAVNKKIDAGKLAKRAWKIFLAEVTEEGLALMDDNTSREAAKRSFRVAEFFMQEEARRKHPHDQQQHPARPTPQQDSERATNMQADDESPEPEEN